MKIEKIKLSMSNPRYTSINGLDTSLKEMIFHNNENQDEREVIKKLLSKEGDFKDLLSLVESISISGFNTMGEKPIILNKNNFFVVAEGNRRIMILKMIFDKSLLDLISNSVYNLDSLEEDPIYYEENKHKLEKTFNNKKKIKDFIKQIKFKDEWISEKTWKS